MPTTLAQTFPTELEHCTLNYARPINYNQNYQMQPNMHQFPHQHFHVSQSIHVQEFNGVIPQCCRPTPPRPSLPQMAPFPLAALAAFTTSSVAPRSPIIHPPSFLNAYTPPPLNLVHLQSTWGVCQ